MHCELLSAPRCAVGADMLSLVIMATPSLTAPECVGSFLSLDPPFSLRSFDLYENWFDDNSSMSLAQTGNYKGVDNIKEYVQFNLPSSPYYAAVGTFRFDSSLASFDAEKRNCVMITKYHIRSQLAEMAGNALFESVFMLKLEWRFDDQKIGDINVFCAPPPSAQSVLEASCTMLLCCHTPRRSPRQMNRATLPTSFLRCRCPPSTTSSARRCVTRARMSGRPTP